MAFKTGVLVLVLAILGIFEVQAASIAAETEMWNNLDAGLFPLLIMFSFLC